MRLVLFQTSRQDEPVPGLLTDRGVVDIAGISEKGHTPQLTMQALIDGFDRLRPSLERRAADGEALPLSSFAPPAGAAAAARQNPLLHRQLLGTRAA